MRIAISAFLVAAAFAAAPAEAVSPDRGAIVMVAAEQDLSMALVGRTWRLVAMGTAPVEVEGQREPPNLIFDAEGAVAGSGGCNRLRGSYELGPDGAISLGPMASTMMACPEEAMRRERSFNAALGVAKRIEIEGDRMRLYAKDAPIAVFMAE